MKSTKPHYPWVAAHDIDGFLGIFIDNLVNMFLIVVLCLSVKMPNSIIFGMILPGAALSVFSGNIFYSYMARKLAHKENRTDVTALPYGINTVSLIAFHFLIIKPIVAVTNDPVFAWKVGLAACFFSGIIEGLGAFIGDKIRKITPRPALLASLAGLALVFLAADHFVQAWAKPFIIAIPFAIILLEYFSKIKLPFRVPAGLVALTAGTIVAWSSSSMDAKALSDSFATVGFYLPLPKLLQIIEGFKSLLPYLPIAFMMGMVSFIATIQNLESASKAGDNYKAFPAMMMNGVGTVIGSIFGNPFPTTVYIGHPGWKALGARSGYSILNGSMMTLISVTGLMHFMVTLVPKEAGYPIIIWVGIIITAQAFSGTKEKYMPAVAMGLIPAIASFGTVLLSNFGITPDIIAKHYTHSAIQLLGEGALLSSICIVAMGIFIINKDFLKAFYWSLPATLLAFFGFIHAPVVGFATGYKFAVFYLVCGVIFLLAYFKEKFNIHIAE